MFPYAKLLIKLRIASWNPFAYFGLDRSKRKSTATAVGIISAFAMLAGYLIWFEIMMFNAFVQLGEPETMLALIVILSTLLTLVMSFFYVLSELFFSKDVLFVSSLPIPSRQLLWAKMLRIWLGEALIALAICLPVIVLYGIHAGKGVLYYLAGPVLSLFVPLIPIALITLISFVLIRASALWKHREKFTVVLSVAFLAAVVWFQMQWTSNIQSGSLDGAVYQLVQSQHAVFNMFTRIYPPAGWYANALSAGGFSAVLAWLSFAVLNVGGAALVAWLLGGSYQQLAIRQSEALGHVSAVSKRKAGKQIARTPLRALYRRETREIFSSPSYSLNCLSTGVVFPILFLVAFVGQKSNVGGLSELLPLLDTVPAPIILAVFTALFALSGTMNMAVGTSVSREGVRHEFFRTLPVAPEKLMLSKLLMGLTIGMVSSLPTAVILSVVFPALIPYTVIGWLCSMLFTLCTSLIGLMLDASHPKFGWKSETEAIKQNGMASLSMFGGMGIIVASGLAFYGLSVLGISSILSYILLCALALLGDLMLYQRLTTKSAQTYIRKEFNL